MSCNSITSNPLEPARNLIFTYISTGNNENGQLIGRFCGNTTMPKPIFTPLPNLWVRYKSDHSNTDRGFRLKFTFTGTF